MDYSLLSEQQKAVVVSEVEQLTRDMLGKYGACAQVAFKALADYFHIDAPDTAKASFALSGGIAGSSLGACGGLAGCVLFLGYFYGRDADKMDGPPHPKYKELCAELFSRFNSTCSGICCRDVQVHNVGQHFDMTTDDGHEQYAALGGHEKCADIVAKTCGWVAEMVVRGDLELA